MKFKLLLVVTTVFSSNLFSQNQWVQKDSVNGAPRSVASTFSINGEGYIMGGLDENGFKRSMASYTYWQDDWDDEPSIGGPSGDGLDRGSACGFSLNNKGYLCLGQGDTNPFFYDLWEFNEDTDAWTQKANFIGSARRQAVSFVINNIAYVGTGIDANGLQKDMYKNNATINAWFQIADFGGTPRKEAVGFSMGGQGYIGSGDDGVMLNDFWQYEPSTDSWVQKSNFPGTARKGAVGWGQFPTGFICLGEDVNFNYTNDLWEYNYFSDSWTQRADYPGPGRTNAVAFIQSDLGFVGTGYSGVLQDDMYAYRRIVGSEELSNNSNTKIFPNPVVSEFNVQTNLQDVSLRLTSIDGKDVTGSLSISENNSGFKANRVNLPTGNYFIQLINNSDQVVHVEKVIFK